MTVKPRPEGWEGLSRHREGHGEGRNGVRERETEYNWIREYQDSYVCGDTPRWSHRESQAWGGGRVSDLGPSPEELQSSVLTHMPPCPAHPPPLHWTAIAVTRLSCPRSPGSWRDRAGWKPPHLQNGAEWAVEEQGCSSRSSRLDFYFTFLKYPSPKAHIYEGINGWGGAISTLFKIFLFVRVTLSYNPIYYLFISVLFLL